jgi:valyl-tRNA synthetase
MMLEKTYRPSEVEQEIYQKWEDAGAFKADPSSDAEPYTIMIPPPNVTGSLHMGHALTFSIQDILIRYHRMKGFDTLWQSGMDHAGIATQMVVERQLGKEDLTRHDLGREKFIERVWQWKEESGGAIQNQFRRLGASLDWSRERFTMDDGMSEAVLRVFVELHKAGLIYRDKRLVNWDPKLQTAISDLEVEQRDQNGKMWYFKYPIEGMLDQFITVGTTRPETMLGDSAVAVHPDDERYTDLIGKKVVLPLVGRLIPIVADDYANPEKGTGAVKITPAHDFNDFEVGRRHDLENINVLDCDAKVNETAPAAYQGLDRFDARKKIVEDIDALGLLEKIEENPMTVPYGDRSGVVIEPWLMDQWFVDAEKLAVDAISAVETGKTNFVPKNWEKTYYEWMRNIQPWCVSRQIWWGHQIPAWYGPDGEIFVEHDEAQALAAAEKHYGTATLLTRDPDVLDTWFSSGLWPFSTLGWPGDTAELQRYYPTDVLVTGFDIIFFWVARMMMSGLHFMDDVPFKTIYIHALVRDEAGQKMSKSKGNIVDPLELMEQYGTDALRFTLAAYAAPGRDVKLADSRVEGYRNFVTKIWNAARFAEINECKPFEDFDPNACELTLNKWIVGKAAEAAKATSIAIESYRFNDAANTLYHFAWGTFCDWYVEFTKPALHGDDEAAKTETRATTAWVLDQIITMLHPIMPFVTEELWNGIAERPEMLIKSPWFDGENIQADATAAAEIDWVVKLITDIRSVRAEMNVPPGAKLPLRHKDAGTATLERLERHSALIMTLARVTDFTATDAVAEGEIQTVLEEATFIIPVNDAIDVDQEKSRLAKEIEKLEKEITGYDKKLSNKGFLAKAPVAVVETQKERREEAAHAVAKLTEAAERLAAL